MAKKADDDNMVQSTIRLPKGRYEDLEKAAKKSGARGVSEEIRNRLEASFAQDEMADPKTGQLLDAIKYLADNVGALYGEPGSQWSTDRFAFDVLRTAIDRVLTQRFQPEGSAVAKPDELAALTFGEGEHLASSEKMGAMIAGMWLYSHSKREA